MKTLKWLGLAIALIVACSTDSFAQMPKNHRLGGGANYWVALDDIELDQFDETGVSYFLSYQYWPSAVGFEILGEYRPDGIGEEDIYAPQIFLLAGQALYAGIGAGINYANSEWAEDFFYALKAGFNLELVPSVYLDIFATYRFSDFDEVGFAGTEIDTDTVYLGAAVRFGF